jgi:anti-anti-sigma factor
LDIDTVERDGATVLIVVGEVDLATAPMLEEKIVAATATAAETVIIDVDRVSFMDSSGLQVLIAQTLAQGNGARLLVTRGSPQVQRLFEVSGLLEHLPFAS